MAKYFCNGNNNNCQPQETSYGDPWRTVVDNNNSGRANILKKAGEVTRLLRTVQRYLPTNVYNNFKNEVSNISRSLPSKIATQQNGSDRVKTGTKKCRCWTIRLPWFGRRRFRFFCRTCNVYGNKYYWKLAVNSNFDNEVNNSINKLQNIINVIPGLIYNNCGNGNSLLNQDGINKCGLQKKLDKQKTGNAKKLKDTSNRTLESIKKTKEYPQWKLVNNRNNTANSIYSWDPMSKRSSYNGNYAYLRNKDIDNRINHYNNVIPKQYDNCKLNNSSLSVDASGIPQCIDNDFMESYKQCNGAYKMAQKFQYGQDDLLNMWGAVNKSIPGNTLSTNKTVVLNANDSCKKWISMFNVWQEKENEALAKPCIPERPIASTNEDAYTKMAEEWNASATKHITQLNGRLNTIKSVLKQYPNILQLKSENITNAPPSMVPTANIKNENVSLGDLPLQYLEMILPEGEQGDTGGVGIVGIKGYDGPDGEIGETGAPGAYLIPNYFNINIEK